MSDSRSITQLLDEEKKQEIAKIAAELESKLETIHAAQDDDVLNISSESEPEFDSENLVVGYDLASEAWTPPNSPAFFSNRNSNVVNGHVETNNSGNGNDEITETTDTTTNTTDSEDVSRRPSTH